MLRIASLGANFTRSCKKKSVTFPLHESFNPDFHEWNIFHMLFRRRIQYIFVHVRPLLLTNVMITVGSIFFFFKKVLIRGGF